MRIAQCGSRSGFGFDSVFGLNSEPTVMGSKPAGVNQISESVDERSQPQNGTNLCRRQVITMSETPTVAVSLLLGQWNAVAAAACSTGMRVC